MVAMKPRVFIPFLLALILALTSQAMAVTRVSSDATGQMVLCIGTQSVTVYVDAEGQPTAAPHFCPDCALLDDIDPRRAEPLVLPVVAETALAPVVTVRALSRASAVLPPARAPPAPV